MSDAAPRATSGAAKMPAGLRAGRSRRHLGAVCASLLVVLLPALVAGRNVDAPVGAEERARLEAALADPDGSRTGPASVVYLTFVDVDRLARATPEERPALLDRQVAVARVGMLLALFAATALFHLAVVLVLGRSVAWLGCLLFAGLPPVVEVGHVLRPEPVNAALAMLGITALVGIGVVPGNRRSELTSSAAVAAATLVAGSALGIAVAIQPAYGLHLFWPAIGLVYVLVQNVRAYLRAYRTGRPQDVSAFAATVALVPWLGASIFALALAGFLLSPEAPPPTESGIGLGPLWLTIPLGAVATLGGVVWALGISALPEHRRIGQWLLLVASVLLLLHRLPLGASSDALPAAPALALLVTIGMRAAWSLRGRRRTRTA